MSSSTSRAIVIFTLFCLVGCAKSTTTSGPSPSATSSTSAVATPSPASDDPGPPSVEGYIASGVVVVEGESYAVKSALSRWEEPHHLQVLLSDTTVNEELAAELKTLAESDSQEAWRKLRDSGKASVWISLVFPDDAPLREAKDVRYITFYAQKDGGTISAMPKTKISEEFPATNVLTVHQLATETPGTAKLELKEMEFGGNCRAQFQVDCLALGRH